MGHPTADDEPNSFVPPGGLAPEPRKGNVHDQIRFTLNGKVHLVLSDEMLAEMWLGWARNAARIDSDLDLPEARRLLGLGADMVGDMVARIKELEKR